MCYPHTTCFQGIVNNLFDVNDSSFPSTSPTTHTHTRTHTVFEGLPPSPGQLCKGEDSKWTLPSPFTLHLLHTASLHIASLPHTPHCLTSHSLTLHTASLHTASHSTLPHFTLPYTSHSPTLHTAIPHSAYLPSTWCQEVEEGQENQRTRFYCQEVSGMSACGSYMYMYEGDKLYVFVSSYMIID